ncbi:MAG: hypothetical protein OEV55_02650 [candidate division Zixibacteria bacterium]|nr:hypothetical protein [candidate division Zixibacteria bacterium]
MRRRHKNFLDKLISWVFWALCGIIFLIVFLTLVQCSVKKPSAPAWNSCYNLPLLVKTYDMITLIEKIGDPALIIDSSGNPGIYIQEELDTIRVKENLKLSPLSETFKDTLGEIPVITADTQYTEILLEDIYPGGAGSIPPFSFSLEVNFPELNDLERVSINRGIARFTAENHLSLALDSFSVELVDSASGILIGTLVFENGIPQDSSVTEDLDLAQKSFSSRLSGDNQGYTPGGTILSLADKYLGLSLCFPDTVFVHSAIAKIPSMDLAENREFEIPTPNTIYSAHLKEGVINLQINNRTNLPADLRIVFPDLTSSGNPLSLNQYVGASGTLNQNITVDGYDFQPAGNNLRIEVSGQTRSSGENLVSVRSSDSISFYVYTDTTRFSTLSGIIEPTPVQIEPMQLNLNLPQGLSSVSLTDAVLDLRIKNGVDFPGYLTFDLNGDKGQYLSMNGEIQPGSPEHPVITVLAENNLLTFSNPIPEQVSLRGQATCGDGITSGTVTENDFICGEFILSSPFEFVLDSTRIEIDPDSNSLDEDIRDGLNDRLNLAKIYLNLENHLPLAAEVELFFSSDSGNLYTNPSLRVGPIQIDPAEIDYSSGQVLNPVITENVIELTHQELDIFQSTPFYSGGRITLWGTDGQKVKFLPTDYIKINSRLELEIKNGG